jgi:hypothetical protein
VVHNNELVGMLTLEKVGEFMTIRSATRRGEQAVGAAKATA